MRFFLPRRPGRSVSTVRKPNGGREPLKKPCRAFSFMARNVCLPFSLLWYSSKTLNRRRVMPPAGSEAVGCVIESNRTLALFNCRSYRPKSIASRKKRD